MRHRTPQATYPGTVRAARSFPYLVLLRMGFTLPRLLPGARCALTAPFHPYRPLRFRIQPAVYFLWHFPWTHIPQALPGIPPCGARTFLRGSVTTSPATVWPTPVSIIGDSPAHNTLSIVLSGAHEQERSPAKARSLAVAPCAAIGHIHFNNTPTVTRGPLATTVQCTHPLFFLMSGSECFKPKGRPNMLTYPVTCRTLRWQAPAASTDILITAHTDGHSIRQFRSAPARQDGWTGRCCRQSATCNPQPAA
jgi:hypothetical protein